MRRMTAPWFYGWNIVAVASWFQAIVMGVTFYSFTMWAPEWAAEFDAPLRQVMLIFLAMVVTVGLVNPFLGREMDRRSIRSLICLGAALMALGFLLISRASALWQVVAVYATLISMGMALAGPLSAQTLAVKWFRARRSFAIGLTTTGTSLGGLLLPPLITYLFLTYGWRVTHQIIGVGIILLVLPLVWRTVRNRPEDLNLAPEAESDLTVGESEPPVFPEWSTRSVLRERNFWVVMLSVIPFTICFTAIQQNLKPYASELGVATQDASYLVSIMAVSMIGGKLFFARQADYRDHRFLYVTAVGILVASMALMLTHPGYRGLMVVSCLLGIASGAILPLQGAIISSRFGPASFGRVMGLFGPAFIVTAAGPYLMAVIRDVSGSYDSPVLILLAVAVAGSVPMLLLKPIPKHARVKETPC